ncbi:MAG: STT3 domain-containing protein, partial [Nanoarchaeota archaeon]
MDEHEIKVREEKIKNLIIRNRHYLVYILLLVVFFVSLWIRTRNLSGLRDITTGGWTLGPDLDPFLFLRWAKYIVTHGSLMDVDYMRYVPLGFYTKYELIFLPYLIAWFHKIAVIFGSTSVEQSAALFPAIIFSFGLFCYFLLTRKMFSERMGKFWAGSIAVIATFFMAVIPVYLPRTIAGIPEKEAGSFLFMFLAFYLFLAALLENKSTKKQFLLAVFSGASTALTALIWGGVVYIYVILSLTILIAFFLLKMDKNKIIVSSLWLFFTLFIAHIFSLRYTFSEFFNSTVILIPLGILLLFIVNYI